MDDRRQNRRDVKHFGGWGGRSVNRTRMGFVGAVVMVTLVVSLAPASAVVGSWRLECPSSDCPGPSPRAWTSMAYDEAAGTVVLFGGFNYERMTDTWTWDGLRWEQHSPATSPSFGSGAMAYDPVSGGVLFTTGTETWLWRGLTKTWSKQSPPVSPPHRRYASMAYDPASRKVVLFGGYDSPLPADTWSWDGATRTWTKLSPASSPPARWAASMATDPVAGNLVLFGGEGLPSGAELDTWTWDGIANTWRQHRPSASPSPRRDAAMAANDSGKVVLHGGIQEASLQADTWEWDGVARNWSRVVTAGPMLRGPTMAYDAARRRSVLFGGIGTGTSVTLSGTQWQGDTWTYGTEI